jgi:GT2 family glycosyltransferase
MASPISVVVVTRNRVERLRRCVDALLSVKTDRPWELVIVDNNSDDATAEFLNSLPKHAGNAAIITRHEKKRGSSAAKNNGWRIATGDIIAFTDDDCYVREDYIDSMISAFESDSAIEAVGGRILLFDKTDLHITVLEQTDYAYLAPRTFIPTGVIQGANMAFKRKTLEKIGGFDENLGAGTKLAGEDIDAVAAVVWSGAPGAYNPSAVVYHHHGRKTQLDAQNLWRTYDRGRGAYYVKYILHRQARWVYLRIWAGSIAKDLRTTIQTAKIGGLRKSLREINGAVYYLFLRSRSRREEHSPR